MLADRQSRRLELASLPIQIAAAGRAGRVSRIDIDYGSHAHIIWLPGEPGQTRAVVAAARKSQYGKTNRIGGSLIQGFTACQHLAAAAPGRPARCLFIGYGLDTYDAQLLANLGFELQAEFLDVLDPDPNDPRWIALQRTPGVRRAVYHQVDARRIGSELAGELYDLICVVRGSVDLMPPDDYLAVLSGCGEVAGPNGALIVPVVTLQFTPRILTAVRRKFWFGEEVELPRPIYNSKLGQFQLDRLGQFRFLEVAFAGEDIDFRQALVDQLGRFARAEPAFSELPDLLAAEASPNWLFKLATINGQAGRVLTLDALPGAAKVGAFDVSRKLAADDNRWGFTARTTLVAVQPALAAAV